MHTKSMNKYACANDRVNCLESTKGHLQTFTKSMVGGTSTPAFLKHSVGPFSKEKSRIHCTEELMAI